VSALGERVFFGFWDADASTIGIGERFLRLMPKSRAALPVGDFRNWPAIDEWAVEIAREIQSGRQQAPTPCRLQCAD
jgi:menaquinone-dependent protoporphyrinogen oxidase